MDLFKIFIYGICMGTFEVVPGISGGTLAVLLNIYDRLINAISNLRLEFKKNFTFLLTIVSGMGVGIYCFSHVIMFFNKNYPIETNCALLGLILGLVPMILKKSISNRFKFGNFLFFIVTLFFMLIINYISITNNLDVNVSNNVIINNLNFLQLIKFTMVGALSAFCLMLPGCSGTMIMLVFGIYFTVIDAIHKFNFLILFFVGAGIIFGLLFGAKIIHYCFVNFTNATYFGILGLILGSVVAPLSSAIRLVLSLQKSCEIEFGTYLNSALLVHIFASFVVLVIGIIFSYSFSKKTSSLNFD